jgi:hypothetical protein
MILTMLVVVIWNILKRITFFGGLSKLLLTVSLSLLCLLWIGEYMAVLSAPEIDPNQPGIQGLAENPPAKVNPFIDTVPSLIAGFVLLFSMGLIIFADDIHCETIEELLGLPPKPPKTSQSMKSESVLKQKIAVVDEAK